MSRTQSVYEIKRPEVSTLAGSRPGAFASALAATAAVGLARQRIFKFRPRLRWFLPAWKLPWRTVVETGWVLGALGRQLGGGPAKRGSFRRVSVTLPVDESEAATKRALLTAGLSFPPTATSSRSTPTARRCCCTS